ncbi:MAG: iron uptake porin [Thermosynechococcaceae cyanobacterium]
MNFQFRLLRMFQPALAGAIILFPLTVKAEPVSPPPATTLPATFSTLTNNNINNPNVPGQVTSVSQLSDVQPTDWAFQALQSLVERYGCIAGYPDGTFRGNRAATRYELAAALNACLDQISDRFATKEDLETVKQLQEEFKAELATLKGRVDSLEARAATLEAQQFSTITKLNAEVIFSGAQVFTDKVATSGENGPGRSQAAENNTKAFVGDRVRLNFDTSFTGRDRLRVRLQARNAGADLFTNNGPGNLNNGSTGTPATQLGFGGGGANNFILDDLWYRFPLNKLNTAQLTVIANSGEFNDFVGSTFNPYLDSSGQGALSRFGRFNPIYRFGDSGQSAGAVLNYRFNPQIAISVGYLADRPFNTTGTLPTGVSGGGLFGGSYSALAQLELKPTPNIGIGITYVHAFQEPGSSTVAGSNAINLTGSTGSTYAINPFSLFNPGTGVISDSIGLQGTIKVSPKFTLSGWAGYTAAYASIPSADPFLNRAEILNWAVTGAFPDLFGQGNVGAIIFGALPRVINTDVLYKSPAIIPGVTQFDRDQSYHIEALYKIRVNGNITITPGLIVILNPENNADNDTIFMPVVRTTFRF